MEIKVHHAKRKKSNFKVQLIAIALSFVAAAIVYLITKDFIKSIATFIGIVLIIPIYLFISEKLKKASEIKKMEEVFPDFIELMSSNLRAGMTIEKALLISSRKEFAPLDREIALLGKDIITGKEISRALLDMSLRINSEKIRKTIEVIISGIKSGGNISVLLEETAVNMRERAFIEKRAASNVLMYEIFIFFAVAIGAPVLFGLSSSLVQIMTNILSTIPVGQMPSNAPFTLTKITISVPFVTYLSIAFLAVTSFLASMIIGLVSKGDEKSGLKYSIPLIIISTLVFFLVKGLMATYFSGFFSP